ncbi:MAG: transcriptional regulator [Verrucomicrobiota bacterium]|jgi:DNA-binding MarR family transcriptional regulator|nr:transcriptional regulator [Verrucomicrobiota bacterium]
MVKTESTSVDALDRVFHEPSRMAILSVLCTARQGMTFTELRDRCGLTDGNLSRHIKTLEEDGVVRCVKAFVKGKPRTTVVLTASGSKRFRSYLDALTDVLHQAREAMAADAAAVPQRRAGLAMAT